jgi:hypothetical protein
MSNNLKSNQYSFVAKEEDVDYTRIVREAPKGTPFILVEERSRDNQAKNWALFVHVSVLNDSRLGLVTYWGDKWEDEPSTHDYRYVRRLGAFPGLLRKEIDSIKRSLNPKNTKTVVTLL